MNYLPAQARGLHRMLRCHILIIPPIQLEMKMCVGGRGVGKPQDKAREWRQIKQAILPQCHFSNKGISQSFFTTVFVALSSPLRLPLTCHQGAIIYFIKTGSYPKTLFHYFKLRIQYYITRVPILIIYIVNYWALLMSRQLYRK